MTLQLPFILDTNSAERKCLRYWHQNEKPPNPLEDIGGKPGDKLDEKLLLPRWRTEEGNHEYQRIRRKNLLTYVEKKRGII